MAAKQLTLFVTFKIQPDRIEEFKEAHRPVWAACAAEPECLFFDVFQDPQAPGTFRFEQFTKPYYATLWPKSEPTWAAPVEVEYFERTGDGSTYRKEFLNLGTRID
ncbi:hypothetical protein Slin14017_G057120 [Septoria linicola]|nr:hypothetical protein Slin14017_G057120 [Septoria linicola]